MVIDRIFRRGWLKTKSLAFRPVAKLQVKSQVHFVQYEETHMQGQVSKHQFW